jgi:hypothetical protein
MLAYLDALIAAVAANDRDAMTRLLADPRARVLTRAVRHEVRARSAAVRRDTDGLRALGAPLPLLQLRHQTAQLLDGRTDHEDPAEYRPQAPAEAPAPVRRAPSAGGAPARRRSRQIELPLSA